MISLYDKSAVDLSQKIDLQLRIAGMSQPLEASLRSDGCPASVAAVFSPQSLGVLKSVRDGRVLMVEFAILARREDNVHHMSDWLEIFECYVSFVILETHDVYLSGKHEGYSSQKSDKFWSEFKDTFVVSDKVLVPNVTEVNGDLSALIF